MDLANCGCRRSIEGDSEPASLCFYEDCEDEFYNAPAPNEDIWKKFQLLPTPPVSPQHEATYPSCRSPLGDLDDILSKTDFASLESFLGLSDMMEDCTVFSSSEKPKSTDAMKSNLIQDCMWSGLNLAKEMGITTEKKTDTISHATSNNTDINASTDCVDPCSVFPYPISSNEQNREPDSLGAETPSDSEDEEIDVVTVNDKVQITRRRPILPAVSSISAQVAAMHSYNAPASSAPRSPSPTRSPRGSPHQVNKRSRQRDRDNDRDSPGDRPPIKKLRLSLPNSNLRSVVQKLRVHTGAHSIMRHSGGRDGGAFSSSSRSGSDSEDGDKRSQHNILERKRRNDLKYSFDLLRDHVPELHTTEKSPKVVILRKATDYILSLRHQEKRNTRELVELSRRREELQRRLRQLRS